MKVRVAAYKLLLEIAEAHKGVEPGEAELLERFRRALGISSEDVLRETTTPVTEQMVEGTRRERKHVVKVMARVALADGRVSKAERERIHAVAHRIGVGPIEVASLLERVEARMARGPGSRRRRRGLVALVAVLVVALSVVFTRDRANAPAPDRVLQELAARYDRALVLVHVAYDLVLGSDLRHFEGTGTGFFVDDEGSIVTCKHVAEPWKFDPDAVRLLDARYRRDPDSVAWTAWPIGARVRGRGREPLAFDEGWHSPSGTLELVGTADDSWVRGKRRCADGREHPGRYHAFDDHDLAVLRAKVKAPTAFIPLAEHGEDPRPLERVVLLGFPRGPKLLEGDRAVSAPALGEVGKVEDTILVHGKIHPGNSGGPILTVAGTVVGVAATREPGEESLGHCIRVEHVRALLDRLR